MIPLRDVMPSRTRPWIVWLLLGANVLVFASEMIMRPAEAARFVLAVGLVPDAFTWHAALTSLFVHAGWLHTGANLLALWLFGDNVEDRMGHARFLAFYLLAGIAGQLAQTVAWPDASFPLVGASGAIAGVLGAYLVLFPSSRVLVLLYLLVSVDVVEVPAVFFVVGWFLVQLVTGAGQFARLSGASTGVWTSVGGLVAGITAVWLFRRPERLRVEWWGEV